jgi:hypothetical protein
MTPAQVSAGMADTLDVAGVLLTVLVPFLAAYHWTAFRQWRRWQVRRTRWWTWLHP